MKSQSYVFLICLLISVFIWLLVVLSNDSFTSIEYPIKYENIPDNYYLVNTPDSILSFRVSSGGFELITLKYLTRKKPIEINLENLNLSQHGDYYISDFSTADITRSIIRNLNLSEELVSISPQNIYFKFEALSGRKVKVVPDLELNLKKQYQLSDSITIIPDSVTILGPRLDLGKINFVETERNGPVDIEESTRIKAKIKYSADFPNVKIVPDEVEIFIPVEKYTESTIDVFITSENTNGLKIKTYPENVSITFFVSLKDFKRIDQEMFQAMIRLPDGEITDSKLKVEITKQPSFVKITKIEPENVEFLVLKL